MILRAIASARRQIRIGICNLSDTGDRQALAGAAGRGVDVGSCFDRADYEAKPAERDLIAQLRSEGVTVHLSNPIFHQSFEKDARHRPASDPHHDDVPGPRDFEDTRDYGLVLARPDIIREVTRVFETDWSHSAPPGMPSPPVQPDPSLRVPDLIWARSTPATG